MKRRKRKGMKTAHIITGMGIGGAERMLTRVLPKLEGEQLVISLMAAKGFGEELQKQGIRVHYLGLRPILLNLPAVMIRYARLLKKEQPDIALSYLIHANLFSRVMSRVAGVKRIYCSIRVVHSNWSLLSILDRLTKGLVDRYIPNSEAILPYLRRQGIPEEKIIVIPNGLDTKPFEKQYDTKKKRRELGIPRQARIIGCVGRLDRQKRQDLLIEALAALDKETHLLLIGEGGWRAELEQMAKKKGVAARVHFLGNRGDIPALLATMDTFCLPSDYEGMSNALLEAMAAGKKIVASDIPENKVLITHGTTGLLFRKGSAKSLLEALRKKGKGMGRAARQRVKKEYSLTETIRRYQEILSNETFKIALPKPGKGVEE